ncbi:tape measure protein [Loigolactobacillus backii]|uniref:tape measure protein n=1 Tax=Loigolactobacillus backii TaxID=375175 RepID=UPI0022FD9DC7|nr:tape measure protein [Loigolactobacillus backii]MDA5386951.1 tape measure protein [Loigolactobacillus backii]MDA5389489.1 tape measure protein [Loigolactobacillus backii]
MAESYSVQAVLSAIDKNFSSTMRSGISNMDNLSKATETAMSTIGKIAAGIGVFKAVSAAVNLVESSVGSAVSRIDTLNNANRTFENMGFSANDTAKMMDGLQASIKGLPTPLDQAVSGVELLAASTNDIGKSQKIWSAMNDGIIGFGGSTAQVQEAVVQLSQAFSNGKVDAATWNSMINDGLGPALNAIARQMGTTTGALKAGLSDGSISVGTFQDALINLDQKGGGGLKSLSQIAKDSTSGISTSIANAKTATTRGVADIIKAIDQGLAANHLPTIGAAITAFGTLVENTLGSVAKVIPPVITKITSFGQSFIPWTGILKVAGGAIALLVAAIMSASKIVAVQSLFNSLKKSIQAITFNPVMMGVAVVVALAAILAKAYQQSAQLRNAVTLIGNAFDSVFGPAIAAAKTAISDFLKSFTGMDSISASINNVARLIGNTLAAALISVNWTGFFTTAKNAISNVISVIGSVIKAIGQITSAFIASGGASAAWNAIVTIAQTVWTVLSTIGQTLISVTSGMLNLGASSGVFETLGTALAAVAQGLSVIAPIIGTVIAGFLVFKTIIGIINGVIAIISALSTVISAIGGAVALLATPWVAVVAAVALVVAAVIVAYNKFSWFKDFVNSIPGMLEAAWMAFASWFSGIWSAVTGIAITAWTGLVAVTAVVIAGIEAAWMVVSPFFAVLWQTIVTVATTIWNTLVTVFTTIVQMVMTVWGLVGPFFTALWTGIVTVATAIWTGLSAIITALIPVLEAAWAVFGPYITGIFTAIWTAAITIWNSISTVITTVMAVIQAVITTVMGVISALWSAAWGVISSVVGAVWGVIVAVVTTAINVVSGIITAILDVISGNWSGAWNAIKGVASAIWNGIKSVISSVINGIKGVISSVLNGIKGIWTSVWNGIKSVASSIWSGIRSVVSSAINGVKSVITSVLNGIKSTWSSIWNGLKSIVSSAFGKVVSTVSSGMSKAYHAVTSWVGNMASAGRNFVMGFVKGITGAIGSAVSAAASMAKKALSAAKSALGIHSPSRVMKKEVGYYTVAGMAVGILDNLKLVTDAAKQLASAAVPEVPALDFAATYDTSGLNSAITDTKKLQSNLQAAVSSQVNYTEKQEFKVEVPVNLDGKEVARVIAKPMQNQLNEQESNDGLMRGYRPM